MSILITDDTLRRCKFNAEHNANFVLHRKNKKSHIYSKLAEKKTNQLGEGT